MALNVFEKQDAYASPKTDFIMTVNPSLDDLREMSEKAPNPRVRTGTKLLAESVKSQFPKAAEFSDMPITVVNLRTSLKATGLRLEKRTKCCSPK